MFPVKSQSRARISLWFRVASDWLLHNRKCQDQIKFSTVLDLHSKADKVKINSCFDVLFSRGLVCLERATIHLTSIQKNHSKISILMC